MQLALQTDFALRTLIYLASKPGRATVGEVAAFFEISRDHVAKVVHRLSKLGWARSIRGVGGGVELACSPDELTVGQVITAFEGRLNLLDCVSVDGICVIQPGCRLKGVLAEAERRQTEYLNSVKLSQIIQPGAGLVQLDQAKAS